MARLLAVLLALLCAAPAGAAVTELGSLGSLEPGASRFWNGPMVASSGLAAPGAAGAAVCEHDAYECFAYELGVAAGGSRLRVAIDHPHLSDIFGLELRSPDGTTLSVATGSTVDGAGTHSAEAFAEQPAAGTWRLVAIAHDVSASAFRMRAMLEGARPTASGPVRDLLPNLQASPPSRIGFAGCQASEASQHGARECLRFAQGPQNVGEGPLILHVRDPGMTGPQYQVIERSDGTSYEVPAGEFEYHLEHRHYHHSAVGQFELYRVADPHAGVLEPAGTGPKQGFCMDDYFIAHWEAFDNAPARDLASYVDPRLDCGVPLPGRTQMRLSSGWGDLYPDALEGQYVDFGDNPDGLYVIRVTTMPERDILETDYTDNSSYAYVRVAGEEVTVLERGLGTSPWDAGKVVVRDGRQPTADADKTVPEEPPPPVTVSPPSAPPAATGGRFAFRLRARRPARLEIRDARRRVVARVRVRVRRARVRGVALPGRYTWRAGRARGRFVVRDQGLAIPTGAVLLVRSSGRGR